MKIFVVNAGSSTLKYQVTKCVRQRDFNRVVKQWEEQYGRRFEES